MANIFDRSDRERAPVALLAKCEPSVCYANAILIPRAESTKKEKA